MGWMKLLEATVKTVTKLPVAVVKDAVTMGGILNDRESYTVEVCEEIADDIDKIAD